MSPAEPAQLRAEVAVEAQRLEKRFGYLRALAPLDLELAAGRSLAVLGPNGAGKSTLLRLMAGLARPSGGSLRVGRPATSAAERRGRVGLIAHATFLYPELSARENLVLAGRLWAVADPAARATALLGELGLDAFADRRAGSFSRGTAQRVAIARALVHEPEVLLLDEPFTGLDPQASERLAERLAVLRNGATTVVLVTHDLARAAALCDQGLVLESGRATVLSAPALDSGESLASAYAETVQTLEAAPP